MHAASHPELDFAAIARECSPALRRYLRHQVGDDALADDLLQETLLKIARGLGDFAGRSSLKTWLYAIASHVVADHLRANARTVPLVDLDAAADVAGDTLALDERLEFDTMNRCVREVIDGLSATDRAAIVLHDLEGLDCAETARVLDLSTGAAKVRIHRARARLAAALGHRCAFYHDRHSVLRCAPHP